SDRRYDQGEEWVTICKRLVTGEGPFDHRGEFFTVKGAWCQPACIQPGGPVLMSAAFALPGREFAARHCDVLFTTISSIENGKRHVASLRQMSERQDRTLHMFTPVHLVCRPSRAEAIDYYEHYANEKADDGA